MKATGTGGAPRCHPDYEQNKMSNINFETRFPFIYASPALIRKHQQSPRIVILGAVCWFVVLPLSTFSDFFIFASSFSFAFGNFAHYCGVLPYRSTERSRQKTCLPWVTSAEKSLSIVIDARRSRFPIRPGSHYSQKQKLAHAKISKNLKPQTEVPKIWEHFQGRTTI